MHTLLDWYRSGEDVDRRMPLLSTYLGHVDPASTYWYLEAVPELLADRIEVEILRGVHRFQQPRRLPPHIADGRVQQAPLTVEVAVVETECTRQTPLLNQMPPGFVGR